MKFQKGHKKVGGFVKGDKHSLVTKLKMSLAKKGRPAHNKGIPASLESKIKNRIAHLGRPSPRKYSNTSIERKVEAELVKNNILYAKQAVLLGISRVDFFLPEYNTVIECDGCHWHGCPECDVSPKEWQVNKVRDKTIAQKYADLGFNFLRIWEHDIDNEKILKEEIEYIVK